MSLEIFYETYFPFWSVLAEADKQLLCENTAEKHFDRSQPVHDNMGCTGLFIVRSGKLRLYMLSEDSKEITLYRLSPGDICMLSASCVLQSITFDVYVDAEEESDCYHISASAFGDISSRYLEVKNYALETAVSRFFGCDVDHAADRIYEYGQTPCHLPSRRCAGKRYRQRKYDARDHCTSPWDCP